MIGVMRTDTVEVPRVDAKCAYCGVKLRASLVDPVRAAGGWYHPSCLETARAFIRAQV